ncbi:MAG: LapA family protein [Sphingomonadales bacterium]|nr:LapA family protein [Sphingomonadales bacterium]
MQIIRTIVWIAITALLVAFVAMNSEQASVNFWPLANGAYLHLQWPVGFIAIFFFFLGAVPMWLLARAGRWRMNRRLAALENSVRAASQTLHHATGEPQHSPGPDDSTES